MHLDLHAGNIGFSLLTLINHSEYDILEYFGQPSVALILPCQPPSRPVSLPPYLVVDTIDMAFYLDEKDPAMADMPLQAQIMDLGIGEHTPRSLNPNLH